MFRPNVGCFPSADDAQASKGQRDGKLIARVVEPGGAAVPNARVTVLLIRDDKAYLAGHRSTTVGCLRAT